MGNAVTYYDKGDEIDVPVIEICNGWTVDEVQTEDDCDDAFAVLTALIVSIEARMDDLAIAGQELSDQYKRSKAALRWKKAALSVVNLRRSKIKRERDEKREKDRNNQIIRYVAAMHHGIYEEALRHIDAGTTDAAIARAKGGA